MAPLYVNRPTIKKITFVKEGNPTSLYTPQNIENGKQVAMKHIHKGKGKVEVPSKRIWLVSGYMDVCDMEESVESSGTMKPLEQVKRHRRAQKINRTVPEHQYPEYLQLKPNRRNQENTDPKSKSCRKDPYAEFIKKIKLKSSFGSEQQKSPKTEEEYKYIPGSRLCIKFNSPMPPAEEIMDLHPDILSVDISENQDSRWCYLNFASAKNAKEACVLLERKTVNNSPLQVLIIDDHLGVVKKSPKTEEEYKYIPGRRLWVNFSSPMPSPKKIMNLHPDILSIDIEQPGKRKSSWCYLNFASAKQAQKAYVLLERLTVDDKPLQVLIIDDHLEVVKARRAVANRKMRVFRKKKSLK